MNARRRRKQDTTTFRQLVFGIRSDRRVGGNEAEMRRRVI